MGRIRNMFPGGNTCNGFFSFYEYMVPENAIRKLILKGGPGVGKSTLMKNVGKKFAELNYDVEYHWCSSDNNSLDGIVIGGAAVCILDGTAPHTVDPRFPGAYDEIINLGDFWDDNVLIINREQIISLTRTISKCYARAYNRLKESSLAYQEWKSYTMDAVDSSKGNRNILALADEFLQHASKIDSPARHLFAAAITPTGVVNNAESLIEKSDKVFAVKGNPGSGVKELFDYIVTLASLNGIYLEIYHSPFDPSEIDLIILPHNHTAIVDVSSYLTDYQKGLPNRKYKRMLDFDQFVDYSILDEYAQSFSSAKERYATGIQDAVAYIAQAKAYHDELESFYIPAMDFDRITSFQQDLIDRLMTYLV